MKGKFHLYLCSNIFRNPSANFARVIFRRGWEGERMYKVPHKFYCWHDLVIFHAYPLCWQTNTLHLPRQNIFHSNDRNEARRCEREGGRAKRKRATETFKAFQWWISSSFWKYSNPQCCLRSSTSATNVVATAAGAAARDKFEMMYM